MPPISENTYRAPRTVAEYVARRLIRGEIDAIPYLTTPAGSSLSDFCSAVTDLFRGLTASLRFTQRQRGQNNGLEKTIVSLEKHGEELGRSMDAETLADAQKLLEDIPRLADEITEPPFEPFGREDALVLAAARWFKHTYFRWVDPIKCPSCGGETHSVGGGELTDDDRAGGAQRVEIHHCDKCNLDRRFPRYNEAKALMKAREGRCGEFAQLFYLFLRVLGLQARYVWNSEDHVWTEYWSPSLQHWVHVDSCEAETNKPQLYDRGWGKEQRWCLAFGAYGAEDVTKAYVDDWDACLARRMQRTEEGGGITENRLRVILLTNTVQRRAHLPDAERQRLAQMDALQAAWMADEAKRDGEAERAGLKGKGRESGTAEWVEARGEGGAEMTN